MKSFRGYLQERAPAWTESLSTALFDLTRTDIMIPLSPSIMKRIWPKLPRTTVFHLTDYAGVSRLKRMQGGKRSISAFWNIEPIVLQDGIRTDGGYVVELEGDILAAGPDDIMSQPDKTGRRWLTLSTLLDPVDQHGMGGGSKLKGIRNDIEEMMIEIIMKYSDDPQHMPNAKRAWIALGKEYGSRDKVDKKIKGQIIGDYIDGMERVMKKNSKQLQSVLLDYSKKRIQDEDPDSGEKPQWDEVVVNNFKIQKIHVGEEFSSDFAEDDDIYGFPFELYHDNKELVKYIQGKTKSLKI
tara:strand:+ start:334 stop:1224 length:891 start_codon:yes stop_codon:yes gene_type:complete